MEMLHFHWSRFRPAAHEFLLAFVVLSLCIIALTSCVTSGDLARIEDAQAARQEAVMGAISQQQAGEITAETMRELIDAANQELAETVGDVKEDVEDRTTQAFPGVPITGNPAVDAALNLAGAALGVFGIYKKTKGDTKREVNAQRDERRRQLGEKV